MKQINVKSVERAMDVVGNKCALPILASLMNGPQRFSNLQTDCDVCPRTLSARLEELAENGLILKNKNGEYRVTPKGQKLQPIVLMLSNYSV